MITCARLAAVGLAAVLLPVTALPATAAAFPDEPTIPAVIVVAGDQAHVIDASTAAPLAAVLKAPIVLTGPAGLDSRDLDFIFRAHPSQVIVVGGTDAVSNAILREASSASVEGTGYRLAGVDRYGTARAVGAKIIELTAFPPVPASATATPGSTAPTTAAGPLPTP